MTRWPASLDGACFTSCSRLHRRGLLALVLKVRSGRSARVGYGIACGALVWMVALPLITFGYLLATTHARGTAFADVSSLRMPAMALDGGVRGANASCVGTIAAKLDRGLPWILAMWLAGAILFLLRLNLGLMGTRRLQSLGTQAVSTELQQAFGRLKTQLAIARTVRLMKSALVQVPTVIGWLRPVVLIPMGCLTGLSAIQIETIWIA